jgi:plastocyanin
MRIPIKSIWFRAGFLLLGLATLFVALGGGNRASDPVEVKIDNFSFSPATLTVPVGTTVRWVNHDDIPHTVVSEDKTTFKSKVLDTDDSFTHTFDKTGSYPYYCTIHPKMTAKVIVK